MSDLSMYKTMADVHLKKLEHHIEKLPNKGLKCSDSQKMCLMNNLHALWNVFNGIEEEDLKDD